VAEVMRAYNMLTFASSPVLLPPSPLVLIGAADWVLRSAPALANRATRLLLSLPRAFLPLQDQLPPSVAAVLSHRISTRPMVSTVTLPPLPPLPPPPPPPPVDPLIASLLSATIPPYHLSLDILTQTCS